MTEELPCVLFVGRADISCVGLVGQLSVESLLDFVCFATWADHRLPLTYARD